jgi:hypothetical protein
VTIGPMMITRTWSECCGGGDLLVLAALFVACPHVSRKRSCGLRRGVCRGEFATHRQVMGAASGGQGVGLGPMRLLNVMPNARQASGSPQAGRTEVRLANAMVHSTKSWAGSVRIDR